MQYPLIGKKTIYIGQETIPPELVQDEAATVTATPSTTEVSSQAGTINVPNGAYDELSAVVHIIIPDVSYLGRIFPGAWTPANFGNGETGQLRFGAGECKTVDPVPIVIHNVCDDGSSQDIRIPEGLIQNGAEFTVSLTDPTVIDVNITPLANSEGAIVFGEGNLDHASKYNPDTQSYEPIDES